jgi:hypothetical protein
MASTPEKRDKNIAFQQPVEARHEDPFREESTDYRESGEKFEIPEPPKNLDPNKLDQPRTNLEDLPKAHQDKDRGNKRPEGVPDIEDPKRPRDEKKAA